MELLTGLAAFLLGVTVRIGLPLGLTAVLVWLLRRLDVRWEAEARQAQRAAPTPVAPLPGLRCWDMRRCSLERRVVCPAFLRPEIPCWQHFRNGNGQLKEECLDCEVFRQAPVPVVSPAAA